MTWGFHPTPVISELLLTPLSDEIFHPNYGRMGFNREIIK
jgi:hypothetical protein